MNSWTPNPDFITAIVDVAERAKRLGGMPSLFHQWAEWSDSPYLNHFLQPDSIIPNLSNPQSLNRYSYVLNNPIRFNDPSGHLACGDGKTVNCNGKLTVKRTEADWKAIYTNLIKYAFGWHLQGNDWSFDELKAITKTGHDIKKHVDELTNGKGKQWMDEYMGDIILARPPSGNPLISSNKGSAWPGWVPFAGNGTIYLPMGWDSITANPNQYLAHELGHIWDGNTGHAGIGTVGGVADGLNMVIGGRIFLSGANRFNNPPGINGITPLNPYIPSAYKWSDNVNGGYGNGSSADYLAEAFAWNIYDPTKLPTTNHSIVKTFVDYSIIAQAASLP